MLRLIIFLLTIVSRQALALGVIQKDSWLHLNGQIEKNNFPKILTAVTSSNGFPKTFALDSAGGNVLEAMKIGQFIRDTATETFVLRRCASARAMLFVSGVRKCALEHARSGIHRPYFAQSCFAGLSLRDAERRYKGLQDQVKRYRDPAQLARLVVDIATGQIEDREPTREILGPSPRSN